jgi:hypothetical protein
MRGHLRGPRSEGRGSGHERTSLRLRDGQRKERRKRCAESEEGNYRLADKMSLSGTKFDGGGVRNGMANTPLVNGGAAVAIQPPLKP